MTMMLTSPDVHTRRTRDADDDIETRVRPRLPSLTWDRAIFQQIMRDLAPLRTAPAPPPPLSRRYRVPNVFERARTPMDAPPLWEVFASAAAGAPRMATAAATRSRRSKLHWFVFALSFGVAFGVAQDQPMRTEMMSHVRAAALEVVTVLRREAREVLADLPRRW